VQPDVGRANAGGRDRDEEPIAGERVERDDVLEGGADVRDAGEQHVLAAVAIDPDRLIGTAGNIGVEAELDHLVGGRGELERRIGGARRTRRRHEQRAGQLLACPRAGVRSTRRDVIARIG